PGGGDPQRHRRRAGTELDDGDRRRRPRRPVRRAGAGLVPGHAAGRAARPGGRGADQLTRMTRARSVSEGWRRVLRLRFRLVGVAYRPEAQARDQRRASLALQACRSPYKPEAPAKALLVADASGSDKSAPRTRLSGKALLTAPPDGIMNQF